MSEKLKACPFCGAGNIKATDNHNDGSPLVLNNWTDCMACYASGPVKTTRTQAITAWNTRAGEKA